MSFAGLKDGNRIADLAAYLGTLDANGEAK
jgi:hypothetical protein